MVDWYEAFEESQREVERLQEQHRQEQDHRIAAEDEAERLRKEKDRADTTIVEMGKVIERLRENQVFPEVERLRELLAGADEACYENARLYTDTLARLRRIEKATRTHLKNCIAGPELRAALADQPTERVVGVDEHGQPFEQGFAEDSWSDQPTEEKA